MLYNESFCSFDLCFWFSFFISFRSDLNSPWSFFASVRLILPSLILSKILKALSNWLNLTSTVLPWYLYIKSSELSFPSSLVISSSLFSTSSLNISFCFEINGVSSLSWVYFFNRFNFSLALNCFYLSFSLIFNCFYLFFKSFF